MTTPAFVSTSFSAPGDPTNVTSTSAPAFAVTAGNLLVAIVNWLDNGQTATVTDSAGNVWHPGTPLSETTAAPVPRSQMFYAYNAAGASTTITATFNASVEFATIIVAQYSGFGTANPLEAEVAPITSNGNAISSRTFSTANANDLVVGGIGLAVIPYNSNSPYTDRKVSTNVALTDQVVATAASGQQVTGTQGGSGPNLGWRAHALVFSPTTASAPPPVTIARTNAAIFYAPFVWQDDGTSKIANTTGAFLDFQFTGTSVAVNMTALATGQSAYPKLRAYIDDGIGVDIQLSAGQTYIPIASGLAAGTHKLRLVVVAFDQGTSYWDLTASVRVTGFTIDNAATVSAAPRRSKTGLFFGDSIVMGVEVLGAPDSVTVQDGTLTFAHLLAEALDIDIGKVGYGGQGFVNGGGGGVPAFNTAYSFYSNGSSRLTGGVLSPAPDYVFCEHGTNPVGGTDPTQAQIAQAITNLRTIAPGAQIFMIVPIGGFRRAVITAATNAAIAAGDARLYLIDGGTAAQLGNTGFAPANGTSSDGIHPNQYGHARIAGILARQIQHVIEPRRFTVVGS